LNAWDTEDSPLVVYNAAEFLKVKFPPRDLLLAPWLESASLAMVYARPGVGKTHFALNLAYALATGGSFLKWQAREPVPVLYVDGEMAAGIMQDRVRALGPAPPGDMLRLVSRDAQRFNDMPNLGEPDGQRIIAAHIGEARVIILDNLSALIHGAKENEAEGWEPVAQWAMRQRSQGRTLIFIHHAGKGGSQRGTSKREDMMDVIIRLQWPQGCTGEDGVQFEVHFDKARSIFGEAVRPFEAKLTATAEGLAEWAMSDVGEEELAQLRAWQAEGVSQAEMAKRLGVNPATISRRLQRAA
jgi:hypothetical protein